MTNHDRFRHTELPITLDTHTLTLDLKRGVHDGLMVFFLFFVNGVRHVGPFDAEALAARLLETAPAH